MLFIDRKLDRDKQKKTNYMTLGIPKIPFKFRDEDGYVKTVWRDLYKEIFDDRILFLSEDIDNSTLIQMQSLLFILNKRDNEEDIFLYINSSDGGARQAIGIYDIMTTIKPAVCTLLMGFATLAPSLILAGGAAGKRGALPHARLMVHQPVADRFSGPSHIVELGEEAMLHLHDTIATIFARHTGNPLSVIKEDLEREEVMSATEAKAYGIIDFISKKAITKEGDYKEGDYKEGDYKEGGYKEGHF